MSNKISFVFIELYKLKTIKDPVASARGSIGFKSINLQNSFTEKNSRSPKSNMKLQGEYKVEPIKRNTQTTPDRALFKVVFIL